MEEAVKQYTVEEVKQLLYEQEVPGDDARILLAIAYLESKFTHGIDGDADPNDKGLWQINPPQYFDNGKPDNMTKAFFQEQGEILEIDEFTEKVKYDIDYATKFAVHIYRYRRDNPKSYGKDPFDAWTTYKEYIKPNISSTSGYGDTYIPTCSVASSNADNGLFKSIDTPSAFCSFCNTF